MHFLYNHYFLQRLTYVTYMCFMIHANKNNQSIVIMEWIASQNHSGSLTRCWRSTPPVGRSSWLTPPNAMSSLRVLLTWQVMWTLVVYSCVMKNLVQSDCQAAAVPFTSHQDDPLKYHSCPMALWCWYIKLQRLIVEEYSRIPAQSGLIEQQHTWTWYVRNFRSTISAAGLI